MISYLHRSYDSGTQSDACVVSNDNISYTVVYDCIVFNGTFFSYPKLVDR